MVLINKSSGKKGRFFQQWLDRLNRNFKSLGTTKIEDANDREHWLLGRNGNWSLWYESKKKNVKYELL